MLIELTLEAFSHQNIGHLTRGGLETIPLTLCNRVIH